MTEPPRHASEPVTEQVLPSVRPRRTERAIVLLFVLIVLLSLFTSWALIEAGQAKHDAHRQHDGKVAAVQALGTANSSLAGNGLAPVATPTAAGPAPTVTVTATGPAGPGGPGPSTEQIQRAVDAYCTAVHCGSGPTAAQVAQAVASYCGRDGQCRGPAGATGVPGADGQNATAEQVADAVTTYCGAHNQCAGPAGPSGAPGSSVTGPSGAPGEPPYSWTYTDALGVQHSCSRTDPFDATAPTYSCD